MGVALGLGIDLVNRSALSEFDDALSIINGQAQYRLTGVDQRLDDQWLSTVEQQAGIAAASPIIETDATVVNLSRSRTKKTTEADDPLLTRSPTLKIIGLDIFRATGVTPALMPQPAKDQAGGAASPIFADDAIFLSAAAQQQLGADGAIGKTITLAVNGRHKQLVVRGTVPGATGRAPIAVMDIGAAQWQLDWLGKLSRIDLRLDAGINASGLLQQLKLATVAGAQGLRLARPDEQAQRMSNLSRAYRVNLNVLALVALLTGGFIVFASMELAVLRMLPMLALVGVLGAPRELRPRLVIGIALILGVCGSALGIVLGISLAWTLLGLVGGDLGGGYFSAARPALATPILPILMFAGLGLIAALCGALSPALKLRSLAPAQALKSGQSTQLPDFFVSSRLSAALALIGLALLFLPAIGGLPLGAYIAIACWLFAGVLVVGPILGKLARWLSRRKSLGSHPLAWLAVARLNNAHQSAFPAMAGVVASFALVCAMAVMVHSFRISVDNWLETVLPADLYFRVPSTGGAGGLNTVDQQKLAALSGVKRASFLRSIELTLDAARPPVALLAQTINANDPGATLALTGPWLRPDQQSQECLPIYISEPAATVYGWRLGQQVSLPFNANLGVSPDQNTAKTPNKARQASCFEVVAIWRDYARQHGAITIDWDDYRRLTGDQSVSNAALTLRPEASSENVLTAARAALSDIDGLQVRSAGQIRALSLRIFDRSFAVTYALEAVALLVGLFGVATTYAGEALARAREFGMLRHLGMTRRSITQLFAAESLIAIGLGVLWGAGLGALIAQILIHRVNPQSFHWTMQTHWPVLLIASGALALLSLGVLTVVIAARQASGQAPITAVRADW